MKVYFNEKGHIKNIVFDRVTATSHYSEKIEAYADFDTSSYTVTIDILRADGMSFGRCAMLPIIENDITHHEYTFKSYDVAIVGPLKMTIRYEIYQTNDAGELEVIYSKPTALVTMQIYEAVDATSDKYEVIDSRILELEVLFLQLGLFAGVFESLPVDVSMFGSGDKIILTNGAIYKFDTSQSKFVKQNYSATELNDLITALTNRMTTAEGGISTNANNLNTHKTSGDHDARYLSANTKYGFTVTTSYNTTTGVLTVYLKDQDSTTLSTATVDLPMELLISTSGSYCENGIIYLKLANGEFITVDISSLIDTYTADNVTITVVNKQFQLSSTYKAKIDNAVQKNGTDRLITVLEATQINTNKTDMTNHKVGTDHDTRYYTQEQVDTIVANAIANTFSYDSTTGVLTITTNTGV